MNSDSKLIEVRGAYGMLMIDQEGFVISVDHEDPSNPEYGDILRFDLQEVKRYYGCLHCAYDILDLGFWTDLDARNYFWTDAGKYVEPDHEWRAAHRWHGVFLELNRKPEDFAKEEGVEEKTVEFYVSNGLVQRTELHMCTNVEEGKPVAIKRAKNGVTYSLTARAANWLILELEYWAGRRDLLAFQRRAERHVKKLRKVFKEAFGMEAKQ